MSFKDVIEEGTALHELRDNIKVFVVFKALNELEHIADFTLSTLLHDLQLLEAIVRLVQHFIHHFLVDDFESKHHL